MGIVFSGVTLCNFQSLCRDVPCLDLTAGQRERKSNGNATASGSQIGYAQGLTGVFRYNESCQFFCFGAGNEGSGGNIETPPRKNRYIPKCIEWVLAARACRLYVRFCGVYPRIKSYLCAAEYRWGYSRTGIRKSFG